MNKTIRLYNLIEFCNNNRNFKLKDVMEEFKISKSTTLRDIKDIQELGVPLYSNGGKNGGFCCKVKNIAKVLINHLLFQRRW